MGSGDSPQFQWVNLLSFRVWFLSGFAALLLGGLPAALLSALWGPLKYLGAPLMVLVFLVVFTGNLFAPPVKCPQCGKRVKVGARRCHHCGVEVT